MGGGVVTSGRGRPSRGVGRVGPKERSAVDIVQDYIKEGSNQVSQKKGMDGMEETCGRNVSDNSHGTVMCPYDGSRQTPDWNRGRPILRGSSQSHLCNERPVSPKITRLGCKGGPVLVQTLDFGLTRISMEYSKGCKYSLSHTSAKFRSPSAGLLPLRTSQLLSRLPYLDLNHVSQH